MRLLALPSILASLALSSAIPTIDRLASEAGKPLPLLIWHGLGDTYDADGLRETGKLVEQLHPGTYVYYVRVAESSTEDRTGTFFGNITTQIAQVCKDIHSDSNLTGKDGEIRADALGFSQGGQFLRGLLERCDGLSFRSLVTFGSQHNGIQQFPACSDYDFLCKGATNLIKGNAWTDYVQNRVVPAQYYRTLNDSTGLPTQDYLQHSNFLADVNNERSARSQVYADQVASMENFVMYVFEEDVTVIPKESGWFAEVNGTTGEVTPLRERQMYKEDWLGLKRLDEKGGLELKKHPNGHMQLEDKILVDAFQTYFGPEGKRNSGLVEQTADAYERVRDAVQGAKEYL
ncbi:palmitoyl-protein thioesterase 1 precursor [Hortaea werneckii]|nr:palmitoyl-protein thioesterase 1 precursor [Hortaea werneckii]